MPISQASVEERCEITLSFPPAVQNSPFPVLCLQHCVLRGPHPLTLCSRWLSGIKPPCCQLLVAIPSHHPLAPPGQPVPMLLVPATPWGTPCTPKCHLSLSSSTPGQRLTPSLRAHRAQHDPQWQTDSAPQSAGLAPAFPHWAGGAEGTQAMMGAGVWEARCSTGWPPWPWEVGPAPPGPSAVTHTVVRWVGVCTGSHPGLMETGEPGGWGKGA